MARAELARVCSNLRYPADQTEREWLPLPRWACFLVELGGQVASAAKGDTRLVVALALPTRAFAAAFTALGAVLVGAASPPASPTTRAEHVQALRKLPVSTVVYVRQANRRLKGIFLGCREINGACCFGVKVESDRSGGLERWLPASDADAIQPSGKTTVRLPAHQKGVLIDPPTAFLKAVLGDDRADGFVARSCLDCVMLGYKTAIRYEVQDTNFAYDSPQSEPAIGPLHDVLRVHSFVRTGAAYHSEIVPVSRRSRRSTSTAGSCPLVIFDGARGYLKWRHRWSGFHWIVLLDPTEGSFDGAVEAVNTQYVQRRTAAEWTRNMLPEVPPGVELMVFEEACK